MKYKTSPFYVIWRFYCSPQKLQSIFKNLITKQICRTQAGKAGFDHPDVRTLFVILHLRSQQVFLRQKLCRINLLSLFFVAVRLASQSIRCPWDDKVRENLHIGVPWSKLQLQGRELRRKADGGGADHRGGFSGNCGPI